MVFASDPLVLSLEQLIYTSFPAVGFRALVSPTVSVDVQQFFLHQIVYQYWDVYNPPPTDFRAVYLRQMPGSQLLFGWIYDDGLDDHGRSHTPYFLGYYLPQGLDSAQLEMILDILEQGPALNIDRHQPPPSLNSLCLNKTDYRAVRDGVAIAPQARQNLHRAFQQRQPLNFYLAQNPPSAIAHYCLSSTQEPSLSIAKPQLTPQLIPQLKQSHPTPRTLTMMDRIEQILLDLAAKPIGIQGLVLVSAEGQPITPPIGLDENMVQIMAGTMLYLAKSSEEECHWSAIDNIALRSPEGHLILSRCQDQRFLLVKAGKALVGLLEGEIKRTIQRLDEVFTTSEAITVKTAIASAPPATDDLSGLSAASFATDAIATEPDEILYRGRPSH